MTTALAAADVTRPGASFYVPAVRVVTLSNQMPKDGERGTGATLSSDVLGDLLYAQVTRSNSGPSQYKLAFNNFYLSTAADRVAQPDGSSGVGLREAVDDRNIPTWPRFKYNDFSLLAFGDRLRVDMRYMLEPVDDQAPEARTEDVGWVPMVCGPVIDMRFTFGASEGARLEISGEDDLSVLQDKSRSRKAIEGRGELNIVRTALQKAGYPLQKIARSLAPYPDFVKDDGQQLVEAIQKGQSTYDLIQKLAERLDFEVFLEFADLNDPGSALEFHFEPCRATVLETVFRLDRERHLLSFAPTIKVVDQYTEVKVEGRHRDPRTAKPLDGSRLFDVVEDELHPKDKQPPKGTLQTAGAVRKCFFPGRTNCFTVPNEPNMDPVRARRHAEAVIRRKAREFFTIEATTIGLPRLRPGQHVEITGMRPPFNGYYYVRQVVTTYGTDGLRTKLTASRPGMELSLDVCKKPPGASPS